MKTIALLRHAKSSWDVDLLDDHARPLNKRGRNDAPRMGAWIAAQMTPDIVLCSSAARTRETFALTGISAPVDYQDKLYHASTGTILRQIQALDDDLSSALIIGHNPGIGMAAETFANATPDNPAFERYPTAAATIIDFNVDHWRNVTLSGGRFIDFMNPKALPK